MELNISIEALLQQIQLDLKPSHHHLYSSRYTLPRPETKANVSITATTNTNWCSSREDQCCKAIHSTAAHFCHFCHLCLDLYYVQVRRMRGSFLVEVQTETGSKEYWWEVV
ncbi:hypothetical protein HD806DRAFT_501202, partial [Xylariaceae sp. AK1471]